MTQAKACEGCSQAHDCKKLYEQIGNLDGPSVVPKVLIAFVLPIIVLIATLGLFDWLLQEVVARPYRTPCALFLSLDVTGILMLAVSVLAKRHDRRRC